MNEFVVFHVCPFKLCFALLKQTHYLKESHHQTNVLEASVFLFMAWCCCCRILAEIVHQKAPRRLMGLPRVAAHYFTVIFYSNTIRVKGLSLFML